MRMHHRVDFVGKHNANKRAYAMEGDEEMFCRVRSVAMGHKLAARLRSSASVAPPVGACKAQRRDARPASLHRLERTFPCYVICRRAVACLCC